jgi:hypothetical protein
VTAQIHRRQPWNPRSVTILLSLFFLVAHQAAPATLLTKDEDQRKTLAGITGVVPQVIIPMFAGDLGGLSKQDEAMLETATRVRLRAGGLNAVEDAGADERALVQIRLVCGGYFSGVLGCDDVRVELTVYQRVKLVRANGLAWFLAPTYETVVSKSSVATATKASVIRQLIADATDRFIDAWQSVRTSREGG